MDGCVVVWSSFRKLRFSPVVIMVLGTSNIIMMDLMMMYSTLYNILQYVYVRLTSTSYRTYGHGTS